MGAQAAGYEGCEGEARRLQAVNSSSISVLLIPVISFAKVKRGGWEEQQHGAALDALPFWSWSTEEQGEGSTYAPVWLAAFLSLPCLESVL